MKLRYTRIIEEYICRWYCPMCGYFNNSYYKEVRRVHQCIRCDKRVTEGKGLWAWINGVFEGLGAFFTWKNAFTLYREKTVKGVYWPMMVFFTAWGFWNLLYYPSLKQWASFAGGVALVCGNTAWVVLLLIYRKGGAGTDE